MSDMIDSRAVSYADLGTKMNRPLIALLFTISSRSIHEDYVQLESAFVWCELLVLKTNATLQQCRGFTVGVVAVRVRVVNSVQAVPDGYTRPDQFHSFYRYSMLEPQIAGK